MELVVTKKLNPDLQITARVEGKDLQEVLFLTSPLINAPSNCGKCASDNITIRTKYVKTGGYKYVDYLCRDCGAHQQFGQYQQVAGCFFLKEWEEKYTGGEQEG